jgi:ribosomal protein L11 methyltransferase
VGTGSGLLAIAAAKLGARPVVGNDNDPVAVEVARENAARNGVAVRLTADPLDRIAGTFDLVLANILANTLVELAPQVAARLAPGGVALLSGILGPQEDEVRAAYVAQGLSPAPARDRRQGEWSLVALERPR